MRGVAWHGTAWHGRTPSWPENVWRNPFLAHRLQNTQSFLPAPTLCAGRYGVVESKHRWTAKRVSTKRRRHVCQSRDLQKRGVHVSLVKGFPEKAGRMFRCSGDFQKTRAERFVRGVPEMRAAFRWSRVFQKTRVACFVGQGISRKRGMHVSSVSVNLHDKGHLPRKRALRNTRLRFITGKKRNSEGVTVCLGLKAYPTLEDMPWTWRHALKGLYPVLKKGLLQHRPHTALAYHTTINSLSQH